MFKHKIYLFYLLQGVFYPSFYVIIHILCVIVIIHDNLLSICREKPIQSITVFGKFLFNTFHIFFLISSIIYSAFHVLFNLLDIILIFNMLIFQTYHYLTLILIII